MKKEYREFIEANKWVFYVPFWLMLSFYYSILFLANWLLNNASIFTMISCIDMLHVDYTCRVTNELLSIFDSPILYFCQPVNLEIDHNSSVAESHLIWNEIIIFFCPKKILKKQEWDFFCPIYICGIGLGLANPVPSQPIPSHCQP